MDEYSTFYGELPTMIVRCNNMLVLRSVITGQHLRVIGPVPNWSEISIPAAVRQKSERIEQEYANALEAVIGLIPHENPQRNETVAPEPSKTTDTVVKLPPCKVQRNYCCTLCSYYTQNPRSHLLHQRDVHGVRLSIHSCQYCQYASRYCQKLKRHIKMVHTAGNPEDPAVKTEKPTKGDCKEETTSEPKELPTSTEKMPSKLEPPEQTGEDTELPCCSKAASAPQNPIDLKKDPEAFFVSNYKNQLEIHLQEEQRLKDYLKTFNAESKCVEKPSDAPKEPVEAAIPAPGKAQNSNENRPLHITEENSEVNSEGERPRIYGCRKCNYITHIKSRYNKHVKYHSMPMIQCDKCEFRTTYKWNLTRHLRSHHGNGIYKCRVCSFSANMKQSLTSHEVNHHSPPIGRAIANKPIRRRRCRVGSSDLQSKIGKESRPNCALNLSKRLGTISSAIAGQLTTKQKVNGGVMPGTTENAFPLNGNESINFQDNLQGAFSMDFSDSEFSDAGSSESCEDTLNGFESGGNFPAFKTRNEAPLHIDADCIGDDIRMSSLEPSSCLLDINSTDEGPKGNADAASEKATGYVSEAGESVSTLSADEAFRASSAPAYDASPQSECTFDDDMKSEWSTPITSDESGNDMNDERCKEVEKKDAIQACP